MPPKVFFVTDVLYNWISQFKISCTNVWRRNSFWNSYINSFGRFDPVTLTFNPVTPQSMGFLCCPGRMSWPSLRRVGQGILDLLNGKGFGTFDPGDIDLWPSDPSIYRVPLLPKMDVWTKFEEGRLRRSQVIDRKGFWHIWP